MQRRDSLNLWSLNEVERGELPSSPAVEAMRSIAAWSREFLIRTHPELGRDGPVCPFAKPSMDRELFFLACPHVGEGSEETKASILAYRDWYEEIAARLGGNDPAFLTFLLVFPCFDHRDSSQLDALHRELKDEFVRRGLMIGQFHPRCEEPGVWNPAFRPLRAPLSLLAVRAMVPFDLPFLLSAPGHLDAYLSRFAPAIPARLRLRIATAVTRSFSGERRAESPISGGAFTA